MTVLIWFWSFLALSCSLNLNSSCLVQWTNVQMLAPLLNSPMSRIITSLTLSLFLYKTEIILLVLFAWKGCLRLTELMQTLCMDEVTHRSLVQAGPDLRVTAHDIYSFGGTVSPNGAMLWKLRHLLTLSTEGDLFVHCGFCSPSWWQRRSEQGCHAQDEFVFKSFLCAFGPHGDHFYPLGHPR